MPQPITYYANDNGQMLVVRKMGHIYETLFENHESFFG